MKKNYIYSMYHEDIGVFIGIFKRTKHHDGADYYHFDYISSDMKWYKNIYDWPADYNSEYEVSPATIKEVGHIDDHLEYQI